LKINLAVRTPRLEPRHVGWQAVFVPFDFLTAVRAENLDGPITQLVALFNCFKNVYTPGLRIEKLGLGVRFGATRQFE